MVSLVPGSDFPKEAQNPYPKHKTTVYERVGNLLDNFECSDCSFLVGKEIINAHKLILAISSPVFKAMLYGPMSDVEPIVISDIEPEVFKQLLNFIYRDRVELISLENGSGLLYASKKYLLPYLSDICVRYIEKTTSIMNVLFVFDLAECFQEERLAAHCLRLICQHAHEVLNNENEHVSASCVKKIISQNAINIRERDLIDFVKRWMDEECSLKDIKPSNENKRKMFIENDFISQLRFFTLRQNEVDSLGMNGFLEENEIMAIEKYHFFDLITRERNQLFHTNDVTDITEYLNGYLKNQIQDPRTIMTMDWLVCRRSEIRTGSPLKIDHRSQTVKLRIKCNKTVFLQAVTVPTRRSPFMDLSINRYVEEMQITIESSSSSKYAGNFHMREESYDSCTDIELLDLLILNEEEWYTITFAWPKMRNSDTYRYSLCYRQMLTQDHETEFSFEDNVNNVPPWGSFVQGLKYCI